MSFYINQYSRTVFYFKIDRMSQFKVNSGFTRLDENIADIYLRQITYKLLKDAPEEPLKDRTVALMGERQTPPSTPRFSGSAIPCVKFFDADPPVRSNEKVEQNKIECPSKPLKDTAVAPANRTSEAPLTICERRYAEGILDTKMSFYINQYSRTVLDLKRDLTFQFILNSSANHLNEDLAVIYLKQITYKLLKDAPEEPLKDRKVTLMTKRHTPPSTPRSSGRATPHVKFFDADPPMGSNEKVGQNKIEDPSEPSKDTAIAPANRTSEAPLTICERRYAEGILNAEPMSLEQFEKKMTQGRILRCIKLFEGGANRNAIRLMNTFSNETLEELLSQLRDEGQSGFARELELLSFSDGDFPLWELDHCFKFFEQEKLKEGMLWAVVLTESQRESLIVKLIEIKKFNSAIKVGTLLTQDNMKTVGSRLIQDRQIDECDRKKIAEIASQIKEGTKQHSPLYFFA